MNQQEAARLARRQLADARTKAFLDLFGYVWRLVGTALYFGAFGAAVYSMVGGMYDLAAAYCGFAILIRLELKRD